MDARETVVSAARSRLIALLTAMRPEFGAGRFPRDDGTVEFYTRVNALLSPYVRFAGFWGQAWPSIRSP